MVIYDTILVRYGELSTKGKNKKEFIKQLSQNIKKIIPNNSKIIVEATYDRIYLRLNGECPDSLIDGLKKIFGISSFSLTIKTTTDIDTIKETCLNIAKAENTGTFKVVARRNDKNYDLRSNEINCLIGGYILENTNHLVDVHNPNFKIHIEVRKDAVYIMSKIIKGAGGYPVGINGKALLLLSGGIDSPVAAYYIMKRGIRVEAVHFSSPPYTSTSSLNKVIELAKIVSIYQGEMRVHIAEFTNMQMEIYKNMPESYAITIMRRMMIRSAEQLAKKRKCLVIATGESIGQVASQTLESISCINEVTTMPIIRPLVTFDKLEIIDKAKSINTYETSILPFEDCCTIFTPKNPVIKPIIEKAKKFEEKIEYLDIIDKMISEVETKVVSLVQKKEEFL
ncbi:MAG: tRNA uracil 4-sulfurtransferase ThiI [Anaerorhabdus sp.]